MLYRLCTEDVNRDLIRAILADYFDGYTLIPGMGYWKGEPEPSLTVEVIVTGPLARSYVYLAAERIRKTNHQESVLVYSIQAETEFVGGPPR